jgi:hypothetical protein
LEVAKASAGVAFRWYARDMAVRVHVLGGGYPGLWVVKCRQEGRSLARSGAGGGRGFGFQKAGWDAHEELVS